MLDKMTFCMTQSVKVVVEEVRSDFLLVLPKKIVQSTLKTSWGDKSNIRMLSWASSS